MNEKLCAPSSEFIVVPRSRQAFVRTNNYFTLNQEDNDSKWQPRLPHAKVNKKDLSNRQLSGPAEDKMLSVGTDSFTPTNVNIAWPFTEMHNYIEANSVNHKQTSIMCNYSPVPKHYQVRKQEFEAGVQWDFGKFQSSNNYALETRFQSEQTNFLKFASF
jgi:hypothetical protein